MESFNCFICEETIENKHIFSKYRCNNCSSKSNMFLCGKCRYNITNCPCCRSNKIDPIYFNNPAWVNITEIFYSEIADIVRLKENSVDDGFVYDNIAVLTKRINNINTIFNIAKECIESTNQMVDEKLYNIIKPN